MRDSSTLHLYGHGSDKPELEWAFVDEELRTAPTYWVVARSPGHPHPRPVWGIWREELLYLSIGTPSTIRALELDPRVTVHLESGTDVVIVEGVVAAAATDPVVISEYDEKYDWSYDMDEYGPLCCVAPQVVLAWRAVGWAGRDSFGKTGRWTFAGVSSPSEP